MYFWLFLLSPAIKPTENNVKIDLTFSDIFSASNYHPKYPNTDKSKLISTFLPYFQWLLTPENQQVHIYSTMRGSTLNYA
jgi:hypothetical protein